MSDRLLLMQRGGESSQAPRVKGGEVKQARSHGGRQGRGGG
jgi:hypothetical protein